MIGFGEIHYRIPSWEAALMITVALIYDVIQIVLVWILGWVGIGFIGAWLVTIWATLTFGLWLTLKGASIMSGKRAAALGIGALIEVIPLVNSLPGWTVAVVSAILVTRAKDLLSQSDSPLAPTAGKTLKRFDKSLKK